MFVPVLVVLLDAALEAAMARPVRYVVTNRYYLLTNRTLMGQHLLRPDPETRRIIRGCLARAVDHHNVDLVCFCFMSNHFHLVARFPEGNMAEFMGQFQGQLSGRINSHRGRSGTIFPERYRDQTLLDEHVLRDKIAYVLNNPVQDQLVARAEDWNGVSSVELHQTGDPLEGRWLDHDEWHNLKRRKADHDRTEAMVEHSVDLHVPEVLEGDMPYTRRDSLLELIAEHRREIWARATGDPEHPPTVLGFDEVLTTDWWTYSDEPPPSTTNYLGVAREADRIADYHEKRREITARYRRVSKKAPGVQRSAFPDGTYPPGCQHCVGPPAAG